MAIAETFVFSFEGTQMRSFLSCLLVLGAVGLTGCGGDAKLPDLGYMHGKITLDGQPLAGIRIIVNSQGVDPISNAVVNNMSYATSDDSGNYTMMFADAVKGVRVGHAKIWIDEGSLEQMDDAGTLIRSYKGKVSPKYFSAFKDIEVKKGETQEVNLELTSK